LSTFYSTDYIAVATTMNITAALRPECVCQNKGVFAVVGVDLAVIEERVTIAIPAGCFLD
jgi:hypothetical protein